MADPIVINMTPTYIATLKLYLLYMYVAIITDGKYKSGYKKAANLALNSPTPYKSL